MSLIVPLLLFIIIASAMVRRIPVYSEFIGGVEDGMRTVISIFPTMLAVLTAVAMLRASGAFEWIISLLSPLTNLLHIPTDVMPLALLRPVSGSGSLGILADIINQFGADSMEGRMAAVMMGSTETTFYTLCVYFKNTRVKKTGIALPCALIGDVCGLFLSVWVVRLLFY